MIVPDLIEPLRAARVWSLHQGYLCSLTGEHWYPREGPLEARCSRRNASPPDDGTASGALPHERCRCGIYGMADHGELESDGYLLSGPFPAGATQLVAGVVALWGRVVCGRKGWRARFGAPVALVCSPASPPFRVSPEAVEVVAAGYGIPVLSAWPPLSSTLVPVP